MLNKQIKLFGKESLVIYIIQFYLTNWHLNLDYLENVNTLILATVLIPISFITAYLCIGFSRIISLSKPLNFVLFGKSLK
jgi:hypothetical protein